MLTGNLRDFRPCTIKMQTSSRNFGEIAMISIIRNVTLEEMDRALPSSKSVSSVPVVACSGQAYRGAYSLSLKAASFRT